MASAKLPQSSHIDIYLRVRPGPGLKKFISLDEEEQKAQFIVPRQAASGYINNQAELYEFRFNGVLQPDVQQETVFERVASDVVMGALDGVNGTVFAYGQTSSGKTYTITGGAARYAERGIIPRAISLIYAELLRRSDYTYSVHIAYLELYNEAGYDLLDPGREARALEDLPRVGVMEDDDGRLHIRNLTLHRATTEEEALNLLFLGDTNRTISETPMNMASSRSHCMFMVHIEARKAGDDTVRRSRLNLVDLAGSERVSKTAVEGAILKEARHINLSLHYLEQVIIALQARALGRGRSHVPYRNSMMTTMLKDSLGGNCHTVMVATVSGDPGQLEESLSTCRFAQRVACIANEVSVNEEVDPELVIQRLSLENRDLKSEIRLLRGGKEERGPLTTSELGQLRQQLEAFVAHPGADAPLTLTSVLTIKAAFTVFKEMLLCQQAAADAAGGVSSAEDATGTEAQEQKAAGGLSSGARVRDLERQLRERDEEIRALTAMWRGSGHPGGAQPLRCRAQQALSAAEPKQSGRGPAAASGEDSYGDRLIFDVSMLDDPKLAMDQFIQMYPAAAAMEENRALVRVKYDVAQALGQQITENKQHIGELKAQIEQRRLRRSLASLGQAAQQPMAQEAAGGPQEDAQEAHITRIMAQERLQYKDAFERLRGLKAEIEHLQMLLGQGAARQQHDFELWLAVMRRQAGQPPALPAKPRDQPSDSVRTGPGTSQEGDDARDIGTKAAQPSMQAAGPSQPVQAAGPSQRHPLPVLQRRNADEPSSWNGANANIVVREEAHSNGMAELVDGHGNAPGAHLFGLADRSGATGVQSHAVVTDAGIAVRDASMHSSEQPATSEFNDVDPEVMAAARPLLTGNAAADRDIVRFYVARAALLRSHSSQRIQAL